MASSANTLTPRFLIQACQRLADDKNRAPLEKAEKTKFVLREFPRSVKHSTPKNESFEMILPIKCYISKTL